MGSGQWVESSRQCSVISIQKAEEKKLRRTEGKKLRGMEGQKRRKLVKGNEQTSLHPCILKGLFEQVSQV